jgi:3,4-dihydroxy 2-butanone 4-phosphate synthase/GTP cyclohydrolase II
LTNNPKKVIGLESYGLRIVEIVDLRTEPTPYNLEYLKTKQKKLGHLLDVDEAGEA